MVSHTEEKLSTNIDSQYRIKEIFQQIQRVATAAITDQSMGGDLPYLRIIELTDDALEDEEFWESGNA